VAQATVKKEYNTFVKGIITEAGPLTFPENASIDEENCVLNRDGSRQRRLGMDYEAGYVLRNITVATNEALGVFRWYNVNNLSTKQFAVVQAGKKLHVFDIIQDIVSDNLIGTLDLSAYITGTTLIGGESAMGYFIVTEATTDPIYLSFAGDVLAINVIPIKIRDFFGIDDGLKVDERPSSLSVAHNYNLLNQGWTTALINTYKALGPYPANNQQWFLGKNADDDFKADLLNKQDFGTTPAPKGRYIIDAFARSTSRQSLSGLAVPTDLEIGRPTTACFAFQRIFYAGVPSSITVPATTIPNYSGFVFFSKTVRAANDFGECYSQADPTSEIDSELVDTDGGYLNIPDSGKIHQVMSKANSVIVFADNGIWAISGDEGGFRGTSYQVVKISSFGAIGPTSIVDAEDSALYWNRGGVYLISAAETGGLSSKNLIEGSIQSLYNSVAGPAKANAVGNYDTINRRISWLYNRDPSYDGVSQRNKYNTELVFDTVLQAWYKSTISSYSSSSPFIAGYLDVPKFLLNDTGVRTRGESVTKYLTVQYNGASVSDAIITFAWYNDEALRDWRSSDGFGTSYNSFLTTGYEIMEDTARQKQGAYIICHLKKTETQVVEKNGVLTANNPSGCLLQARWDWADSDAAGKYGVEFQVYRIPRPYFLSNEGDPIDLGQSVITSKSRLPGRGRSLSLNFRSDEDKDFLIYGWAIKFTGNANV
jgi:hypothetical protein